MIRNTLLTVGCLLALAGPAAAQMGGGGMGGGGMGGPPPSSKGPQEDLLPEVDEAIANDAQKVFEEGEKDFKERSWLPAIAHYRLIMQKFSFNLPLAAKSELRLGDVAFERERYSEARGYYRNFLRFHPKHEEADYAGFRVGLCAFKDIPSDIFFEPPSNERDQSQARAALVQMRDFVEKFPASPHVPEAKAIIVQCEDKLASHELYVAKFYAKREKWRGTAQRTEGLAKTYPTSTLAPEALALAVESRMALNEPDVAKEDLAALEALKPEPKVLARAQKAVRKGL
jgi:outer membrane protein assembly factor BamD